MEIVRRLTSIPQGRGLAAFFLLLGALLLLAIFRPGDQSAAAVTLGDPTAWVEHGMDGELLQISALTGDIMSRIEVADPGEAFAAFPHGDGAVVLNTSSSVLSLVDGSTLEVTAAIDLPLADGAESRTIEVFGQVDPFDALVVVDEDQVLSIDPRSGDVTSSLLERPITSLTQNSDGQIFGLDRETSSLIQVDPLGPVFVAQLSEAVESGDDERQVLASGGSVFTLDPMRLSLAELQTEGGLGPAICMRSAAAGAVHGGGGPSSEPLVLSLNAPASTLGISGADGSCRDIPVSIADGTYGTPIIHDGVGYLPFWSEGRIVTVDLLTGETLSDVAFGTRGEPFELELFGSDVWANERLGPIAAVVEPDGVLPVVKVSAVLGSAGLGGEGGSGGAVAGGEDDGNGLRLLGDEGASVLTMVDEADSEGPGQAGDGNGESPLFDQTDPPALPQLDAFGITIDAPTAPQATEPELQPEPQDDVAVDVVPDVVPEEVEEVEVEEIVDEPVEALVANFTVSSVEASVGQTVRFTDTSTGLPVSWTWSFGDGTVSETPDAEKIWSEPGSYDVTLTVTNAEGQQSVQATTVGIVAEDIVLAPNADFRFSRETIEAGESITFESLTTGDVDILEWDFGNGRTAVGEEVTHAFEEPGTFRVVLTATNEAGSSTSGVTVTVLAGVEAPIAAIAPVPQTVVTGQSIRFESVSLNEPTRFRWNFGDGTGTNGSVVRHSYDEPGEYRVVLRVENSEGNDRAIVDITVEDRVIAPVARFSQSATQVLVGETVTFTDTSLNNPTRLAWNFDDGNQSDSANPRHSWDAPGTYRVSLRARNEAGADAAAVLITVREPIDPPEAAFALSDSVVAVDTDIRFEDRSTNNPTQWLWDFEGSGQETAENPFRRWQQPGTYTVRLTAINEGGRSTTETEVTVLARPTASFRFEMVDDDTVRFINESANADSYTWNFGDGTTSNEANPTHDFRGGSFDVTLTASNEVASATSQSQRITISQPPVARISCSVDGTDLTCSGAASERAVRYEWSADGSSANTSPNGEVTTFQFPTSGRKDVTLTVTAADGSTDTATLRSDRVDSGQRPRVTAVRIVSIDGDVLRLQAEFERDADTWEWQFDGLELIDGANSPSPSFRVPANGVYTGSVTASNEFGFDEDSLEFTIDSLDEGPDRPPRVRGVDVISIDGNDITLQATFDRDPEEWVWVLNGATLVSGGDTPTPTFRIPENGTYSGTVTARNVRGEDTDPIEFTFDHLEEPEPEPEPEPDRPPRVLGVRIESVDGNQVTLIADFDRDPQTWEWQLLGATLVSGGDTNMPTFEIPANGTYVGTVRVTNGAGQDTDPIAFTFTDIE